MFGFFQKTKWNEMKESERKKKLSEKLENEIRGKKKKTKKKTKIKQGSKIKKWNKQNVKLKKI